MIYKNTLVTILLLLFLAALTGMIIGENMKGNCKNGLYQEKQITYQGSISGYNQTHDTGVFMAPNTSAKGGVIFFTTPHITVDNNELLQYNVTETVVIECQNGELEVGTYFSETVANQTITNQEALEQAGYE